MLPRRAVSSARNGTIHHYRAVNPPIWGKAGHAPLAPKLRGFTLIELMVVIGIVSVLMILVLPAVNGLKNAREITNSAY